LPSRSLCPLHSDANKELGKHINLLEPGAILVGLYTLYAEQYITIFAGDFSATEYKSSDKNKMGEKGDKAEKRSLFPMSIKKDLIPGQIHRVVSSLVEDNVLDYFLKIVRSFPQLGNFYR
jgi:hypothetical protein